MSKAVLEPLLVVSLLVGGVWFNRKRQSSDYGLIRSDTDRSESPDSEERYRSVFGRQVQTRSTVRFQHNFVSTVLDRFPFIVEVVYWGAVYLAYQFGRGLLALYLNGQDAVVDTAREHGLQVLAAERALGIQWENAIQSWFINSHPGLLQFLNRVYSWVHIPAVIAFLGYLYKTVHFDTFSAIRRTLALANLVAFVIFSLYPTMPPRLLPEEYGFVDSVHQSSVRSIWNQNKFQNQYAAMPSLHEGYAFISGVALFCYIPHHRGRIFNWIALMYPMLILITILATANHYLLDALAGIMVACLAYAGNAILLNLLVIEDFLLYILHVHKPEGGHEGYGGNQLEKVKSESA